MKKLLFRDGSDYFHWKHILFMLITGILAFGIGTLMTCLALDFNKVTPSFLLILTLFMIGGLLLLLLPKKMPAIMQNILFSFIPATCFYLLELCTHIPQDTMEVDAVILNLIFYYLIAIAIVLVTGRIQIATYALVLISSVTGLANYFVILFRSIPILPWDFYSLNTAASVADNYEYTVTFPVLYIILGFLLLFLLAGHFTTKISWNFKRWNTTKGKSAILGRFAAIFLCMSSFLCYIGVLWIPNLTTIFTGLDDTLFAPTFMFNTNGFAVSFIMDLRFLKITQPEDYSSDEMEELFEEYEQETNSSNVIPDEEDLPNVIVIMNETFSDPSVLGEFTTNIDYIPFIRKLMAGAENTVSGYMYSSVLGGNTANSEFEFLTGNTMGFFPIGSVPYQQYLRTEIDGLTEHFNTLGYKTIAMHPYYSPGWNRDVIYDLMNFNQAYFLDDFLDAPTVRKYVSDQAVYNRIIDEFENKGDSPLFTFAVTMQNHGGYSDGNDYDNFSRFVRMENASSDYFNTYLSLLHVSDIAFQSLIFHFQKVEEKTIILMFGDHQPNDHIVSNIYKVNDIVYEDLPLEEQQNRYMVPFVLWANYDIQEENNLKTSANYLSNILMETAELPLTTYQTFLKECRTEIPVITANMYIDKNGIFHTFEEENEFSELLRTYEELQYHLIFGDEEK